jgi:predicted nucleic-acid-binding protein
LRPEPIWIGKTVLLEAAWVLRSLYGVGDREICSILTKLLGLPGVEVEQASDVAAALTLGLSGIELADALHLTSRPDGADFVSFDKSFVKGATRAGVAGARDIAVSK